MHPQDRTRLTVALREHVTRIAADLRQRMLSVGSSERAAAERLHAAEEVGDVFEVWTDVLSRRTAVLWVLKSVYVRVLEDRGLLAPGRLLDPEAQQLFEALAPHLGETAFLRWIYRDLASERGGLPELFGQQPAEVALPSDELSRALIAFWRQRDVAGDNAPLWSFAHETFEGELMGDLYQELDPVVKDRFALCQTPEFVRAFLLDRTLAPAIETFGADEVRLLDPSCGSGHFLIDGLKRLVAATAAQHPDWSRDHVVTHALDRVVGIDLNDYACALARARVLMTAAELAGVTTLAAASQFHPHVYWADGLEQVERADTPVGLQLDLFRQVTAPVRATLTRADIRVVLAKVLAPRFHAVVANPPYITEKDKARKTYHREKLGRQQRYVSAYREYSLGAPFTERCFQLAVPNGFVGIITSNNFMKREFGKTLIEQVLSNLDLTLIADTSQAYIPFHGTPTVLLFGRNRHPQTPTVRAVMGKRGESGVPTDPAQGKVWSGIRDGYDTPGFETEYISVADMARETLAKHPWSLGGGGAAELKEQLQERSATRLSKVVSEIGFVCMTRADDVYFTPAGALRRAQIPEEHIIQNVEGDRVRDWAVHAPNTTLFPYDDQLKPVPEVAAPTVHRFLWPYRTLLWLRREPNGNHREIGLTWWEWSRFQRKRFHTPLSIAFAFVATHNHFVLDRGGKVFNRSAPVIKLPDTATEDDHVALLGLLNSATACFWMKQVFHCKGSQGVNEGMKSQLWEQFFEFDATKIKLFPIPRALHAVVSYARQLDQLASKRTTHSAEQVLNESTWNTAAELQHRLVEHQQTNQQDLFRMVALQEELDWQVYGLYGLDAAADVVTPDAVEPCPPTWLPWNVEFATRDQANRAALADGQEPEEQPSDWWTRHGWEPLTELPDAASPALRARVAARRARIAANPALTLIETANFKRRWFNPDYAAEEAAALKMWLADRVEVVLRTRTAPANLQELVVRLQDDPRVLAVCEVLTGRRDFHLTQLVQDVLQKDAVPNHPVHRYKPSGLIKRQAWEQTWADQRREDADEKVTPQVPPAYGSGDFLKTEYWQLRGKLDVPKERFIALTEVPGHTGPQTLYGWAGWTAEQRVRAMLRLDEHLEDDGHPLADRIALLDSAWRLLPDIARNNAAAAQSLKAELQALVGPDGPGAALLSDWQQRFPPPSTRATPTRGRKA